MSITILDGGIGQELMKRSGDAPTPLWSTQVMIDHPGMVAGVHADYFRAGAQIATTNTYAIHRDRLRHDDIEDQFEDLLHRAISEAQTARNAHGTGLVAGSLGPLVASYRPDLCPPPDKAEPIYDELVGLIAEQCDVLVAETVASVQHAEGVLRGAANSGLPIWLAVTVDDEDGTVLRSGEPVQALAATIKHYKPAAVLANCSAPEAITATLDRLQMFDVPFGAYANGFTEITKNFLKAKPTVDALQVRDDVTPARYADFAETWVEQGATLIGGCCEVGPAHIAELQRRFG